MKRALRRRARFRNDRLENGQPWIRTSGGPVPIRRYAMRAEPVSRKCVGWERNHAVSGATRGELSAEEARRIAAATLQIDAPVVGVQRITRYDTYYYARPHREWPLPTWRVSFADAAHSTLYVDPLSGRPTGFIDSETRRYRWLRDGLHSFDFPGLNGKRPLWDLVLLPLMLGGTATAFTGVWLLVRRLKRLNERRPHGSVPIS